MFINLGYVILGYEHHRPGSKVSQAVSTMEIDEILEFLGVDEGVSSSLLDDPYVSNYFAYESGQEKPMVKSRLKHAYDFWKNNLNASEEVLQVIQNGYHIPFCEPPIMFNLDNNKSAYKHSEFVTEAIDELLEYDLIEEWQEPPFCISPLSVAVNASNKKRLILDLSEVNKFVKHERIKLEDQNDFFDLAKNIKWAGTFDLKSAYHQIDIHKDHYKYLGFAWWYKGKFRYFVFKVVAFGLCSGPKI